MKQKVSGNKTEALVEKMAFLSRKAAVAFYLSKTSIRAFTVSLLSLIIALSLLAGSIYYTGASRNDLYLDILRDTETGVNGQVEFYSESYTETILTDKAFLDAEIIEAGLEGVYKAVPLYPSSFIETYIIDGMDVEKEILISGHDGLNDSVLSECKAGSRFPVSPSEVLVFAPDDTSLDVDAVTEVTLTYSIYPGQTGIIGVSHEFNLTVAAIMTDSSMSPDSAYRDLFPTSGYRYFTSLELFLALAQEEIIPNTGVRLRTYYRYIFDTSSISSLTAIETVNNILIMERIVAENTNLRTTGASSELRPGKNDADFFLSLFGLLTLPVLILLFLFVIYSLGANSSTKQKHIEFMKSKGDSGRSMFLVFLFEILVIAFTAVIVSTLAGLPVALLMGMSSGFLTFSSNVTISNYLQVINSTIVQQLVVIGICLTVITHVPAIVMLYRTKNDIAERDASVGKKKRFRFGTGMIEILLMVIGIAGIIIAGIITELFSVFAEEMDTAELHALFAPFLSVLMIFSPLFFLLGAIMFINKLITASFPLLSRLFQKIDSRLLVTAIKMLNVNIRFTARTSLVMAIAMSFLVVLSFLPQSAVHYNEENMYYENGADIAIRLGSSSDGESDVLLSSLGDIEELTTTKVIYSEMHYYFLGGGYLTGAGIFLGIMPDFSSVAYWKDSYGEPLENLVSTLYEQDSQEATPVLVDQHTLELLEGDKYKLSIAQERSGGFASYRIAINPVEQIDYFPGLYRRSYLPQEGHYICKYSFFTGLDEYTGQNFVNEKEIWGKILPGADPLAVTEKVKEKLTALGYSDSILFSATEELSKMRNSLSTRLLWLTVNYNLLGGLLVLLIVVVLFLYARSTQNTPEIGYSLALGMKPRQLLFLTVTESLLLFLISSISGLAIGVLLLVVIMPFITGGITRGPPFNIYFDGPVFLVIYGLLLLVMCLTGFIAALLIKRKNIASLVKDERVDYFSRGLVNQALIDQGKEIYPGKRVTKFDKLFVFKRKLTAGLQLSRSNMRLFIGSLLGLVIALSMLTGCLYYIEFSRPELYLDYFEEEGYDFLEFRSWSSLGGGKTVEEIMEQDQFLDQEVDQHGLGQLLQKTPLSTSSAIQERTRFDGQENRQVIRGYQDLDEPLLAEAVTGSRLPANRSEVLVVAPASSNLTLNQSITVNIVYSKGLEEVEYQLNLTVTGMYTSQTLGDGSLLREIFPLDEYHFILPLKYFIPLVQAVDQDLADAGEEKTLDLINLFMYGINYETIDRSEAVGSVETLIAFLNEMKTLRNSGKTALQIDGVFLSGFSAWTLGIYIFMIQFLIISIPVFVLVAVMVFFSLGIINEKRLKAVELLRNKGFSGRFVFAVLFLETVLIAILATVIALVAGLPLALVMGTTNGFLRFNAGSDGYVMVFDPALITMMLVLGITFTLLTHVPSIVRLSELSVANLKTEASRTKKRKIKVLLSQFDLVLLATGLLGMLVFTFFIGLFREAGSQEASNLLIFIPLLTLFAFISPFLFLIGCILGFNRLISPALNLMSSFFWKFDWRLLATVTRNLSANIKLMTRTTLLIAVTISFLVALIVLPVSVQQYQQEQLYYSNGSDITMTLPVLSEDQNEKLLTSLDGIQGLAVTSVRRGLFESFYSITGRYEVYFLGIEPDFASIAHWQAYYDDDTLETLVASLFSSQSSHPVIADATTGKQVTLDQSFNIQLRQLDSITITPIAITDNFPGIAPNWSPGSYYLVCQYDQIIAITGLSRLQLANEIWGKVLPGYEQEEVLKEFREAVESQGFDGNDVTSSFEELDRLEGRREARLIWQVVNYNFLGGLAIILSVIILYAFASLSRNIREIGLGRALGLKKHQIILLLLTEPVMLFFMTGIPGGTIGLLLLVGLITLFGPILFWGPPFILDLSLPAVVSVYGIIFVAMVIIGMTASVMAARKNISQILKVE